MSDLFHYLTAFPAYSCSLSIFQKHYPLLYFCLHFVIPFPDDLTSRLPVSPKSLSSYSPISLFYSAIDFCTRAISRCGFHFLLPASCLLVNSHLSVFYYQCSTEKTLHWNNTSPCYKSSGYFPVILCCLSVKFDIHFWRGWKSYVSFANQSQHQVLLKNMTFGIRYLWFKSKIYHLWAL